MTALDFIRTRNIRSREVLLFVLKNEIAKIEEKHAQYVTYHAAAKAMEKAGQDVVARNILVSANNILVEAGFIQVLYTYVLTGDGVDYLSSADIGVIEALPYLKNR